MRTHHAVAVPLAALIAGLLAVDTVVVAVTGERTVVTDDEQGTLVTTLGMALLLGATVLACCVVVAREKARFDVAGRVARATRRPLLVGLGMLVAGSGLFDLLELVLDVHNGPVAVVSGLLAGLSLILVFVPLLVLGLATLRHNPFGLGARVLAALGPVAALTVLLGIVAPDVASPVLLTGLALVGTSLIGVRAPGAARTGPAAGAPAGSVSA